MDLFGIKRRDKKLHEYIESELSKISTPKEIIKELSDKEKKYRVMTKEQLIQIAQVAFPERVKQFINFENAKIHSMSGVHRLYDKYTPFMFTLPKECYLSVFIGEDKFIQIESYRKAFNHYAAIKEMERFGLV